MKYAKTFLLAGFILSGLLSSAQTRQQATEIKEVFFPINYIHRANDTLIALIEDADGKGIKNNQPLKVYQIYHKALGDSVAERSFKEVGAGRALLVNNNFGCFVKLYDPHSQLHEGDLISFKIEVPVLPYRSIFSDLVFQHLRFADQYNKPLYYLDNLLTRDSRRLEDSIMAICIKDIKETYESVKDDTRYAELLGSPRQVGRYKGRSVLTVMRDVTKADVQAYFEFVKSFPGKYLGQDFKVNETFATWAINDAPYSSAEVKSRFLPAYQNAAEFNRLLAIYKNYIVKEGVSGDIADEALSALRDGRNKEAENLMALAWKLAYAVPDTSGRARMHLIYAETLHDKGNYATALPECDASVRFARWKKDYNLLTQGMSKKAYCYMKLTKYQESQNVLDSLVTALNNFRSNLGEDVYNDRMKRVHEYRGSIYYAFKDYKQALDQYDRAIEYNTRINTYESTVRNGELYKFVGDVSNNQSNYKKGLTAYLAGAKIYRDLGDRKNEALIKNDIAYTEYNLGNYRKSILIADTAITKFLAEEDKDYNSAGYARSLQGSSYWELGKYDSAVMVHEQSIAWRKKANNINGQAFSWKQMGELYSLSGLKVLALSSYDSAALLYGKTKDKDGLSSTYLKKGKVYLNDENYKKAAKFFTLSIDNSPAYTAQSSPEGLYNLAIAYGSLDTVKARKYYEEVYSRSKQYGNTGYLFSAAQSLARLAYRNHNPALGDRYYQECLDLRKEFGQATIDAQCIVLKGDRFYNDGMVDSALACYSKALSIYDTTDKDEVIWQLNTIANIQISKGEFAKAREAYERAIVLAQSRNNNLGLGYSLQSSSFLYGMTGQFGDGLRNSDSAIAIFNRSGNMVRLSNTLLSRGTLLKSMGEYNKSIQAFLKADSLVIDEALTDSRDAILNNMGVTYYTQGDYKNALKMFELALKELKPGVVNETSILYNSNKAECLFYLKKSKEAEDLYVKLLPVAKEKNYVRIATGIANGLGKLYFEDGRYDKAQEQFDYSLAYTSEEKEKYIETLTYLGKIAVAKQQDEAAKLQYRKAVHVVTQYKIAGGWEPFYELGLVFYSQKKFDSSVVYFKTAVELLDRNAENLYGGEEARKIFNNDPRKADLYNKITFSYYNLGNVKDAWSYANRGSIASVKELSGTFTDAGTDKQKGEALQKLAELQQSKKALLSTAEKQTGAARAEILKKIEILEENYSTFLLDVLDKYPDLGSYFSKTNADQFYNYKGRLPEDLAVTLYLQNDKTLMIFTLTNEKLAVDTMTADVASLVKSFITSAKHPEINSQTDSLSLRSESVDEDDVKDIKPYKDLADNLYNILIAPIQDKISKKKKLCIIPAGIFSNLPFQCLGRKTDNNGFRFLIEDYSVFYTNKMQIFDRPRDPNQKNDMSSFAAFGVPDKTLKYNTIEVQQIGKILGTSNSDIYADSRATESVAKSSMIQKKNLHFATHGVLNYSKDFSLSYLKFLPDADTASGNNGQLTIREILSLPIRNCNMVVLSACETAINKEVSKGWNVSPANAFLERQVSSVVASLWKVDDKATGMIMDEYYANLARNMSKLDALRLAQKTLSSNPKYVHPFYWGAFVLYGDWR